MTPSSSSSSSSSPPRRLSLVITLSADIHANTPIPAKIENTLRFLSLYQTHFPFRAILFTRSKRLISRGKQLNLTVVRKVQKNAFGMPVLRAMLTEAKRLFAANHYGYINADILFSPALFPALSLVAAEPSIEKSVRFVDRFHVVLNRGTRLRRALLRFKFEFHVRGIVRHVAETPPETPRTAEPQ